MNDITIDSLSVGLLDGGLFTDDALRRATAGAARVTDYSTSPDRALDRDRWVSLTGPEIELLDGGQVDDVRDAMVRCAESATVVLAVPPPQDARRFVARAVQGAAAATEHQVPAMAVYVARPTVPAGKVAWLSQSGKRSGYGVLFALGYAQLHGRTADLVEPSGGVREPRTPAALAEALDFAARSGLVPNTLHDASPLDRVLRDRYAMAVVPVLDVPGGHALLHPGELPARSVAHGNPSAAVRLVEDFEGDVVLAFDSVELVGGSSHAATTAAAVVLGLATLTGIAALEVASAPSASAASATSVTSVVAAHPTNATWLVTPSGEISGEGPGGARYYLASQIPNEPPKELADAASHWVDSGQYLLRDDGVKIYPPFHQMSHAWDQQAVIVTFGSAVVTPQDVHISPLAAKVTENNATGDTAHDGSVAKVTIPLPIVTEPGAHGPVTPDVVVAPSLVTEHGGGPRVGNVSTPDVVTPGGGELPVAGPGAQVSIPVPNTADPGGARPTVGSEPTVSTEHGGGPVVGNIATPEISTPGAGAQVSNVVTPEISTPGGGELPVAGPGAQVSIPVPNTADPGGARPTVGSEPTVSTEHGGGPVVGNIATPNVTTPGGGSGAQTGPTGTPLQEPGITHQGGGGRDVGIPPGTDGPTVTPLAVPDLTLPGGGHPPVQAPGRTTTTPQENKQQPTDTQVPTTTKGPAEQGGSTGPGSTGPGSTGPGSTGPGSTRPGSTGHEGGATGAPTQDETDAAGTLAYTGAPTAVLGALAAVLIAAGTTTIAATREREDEEEDELATTPEPEG